MPIDSTTLKAILSAEKASALGVASAKLAQERTRALDYYVGDMANDMPSQDGRSSAVSTDVADTVEGLMPALMEIFAAGEEVVRFDAVGPEDEDAAEQETDYVNHVFMQKNPGFLVLYTFIKDALLSKVGVVKVSWDDSEREETETYLDQPDDAFALLVADPDIEVSEHSERTDPETGEKVHDVTLVKRKAYGCARVDPVPPEEFGISKRARNLREAAYCYHEPRGVTESDLIAQGYDAAQIKGLPTYLMSQRLEETARDTVNENTAGGGDEALNTAMRPVRVTEHYLRMDYEGSDASKVKLYRITTGGEDGEVLRRNGKDDVVAIDVMPFAAMTPVIQTHRFFGRSIADLVMDIQRIKTALLRQLLDNAYLANNQRVEVAETLAHDRTLDDLLVNRPGGVVRVKNPGAVVPIPNQPIGNFAFPLIEYVDATREWRTGVTRQGQGIDANALQNQSATAVNQAFTAAQARMKLIARIFAETGIRDLFALLHGVIRKNDKKQNTVRLRNKWVAVDPRNWRTRDDMTINVGLGTGSKAEQVSHLMMILGMQKEAILQPGLNLVTPKNIYNTAEKLIEKIGLKTIEPYFTDPDAPQIDPATGQPKPPQPPPPDPKLIETQGKLAIEQQKAQTGMQMEHAKLQAGAQSDQQKMQMDIVLKREQMAAEFQLRREQMQAELELKREQMNLEAAMKREAGFYAPKSEGITPTRMGGEVG